MKCFRKISASVLAAAASMKMKLVIILSLLGLAAAGVFQHQLIRVESRKSRMEKAGTWEAYKKSRDLLRSPSSKSISQPMIDFNDSEYLANITVGTPPQPFLVHLDTGSSDFWIPDSSCSEDDEICRSKLHIFDSNESTTYVPNGKPFHINYDSGFAGGFVGEDTVRFGNPGEEVLIVPKSTIGQANLMSPDFEQGHDEGVLGLAFPSINTQEADPILFNAFKQGLLDKPIFTVYLEKRGQQLNVPGGAITYGGLDTEHCSSDVDYVNLTSTQLYEFQMDSFSMGSVASSAGWKVISDTGTTMIVAPSKIYEQLAKVAGVKSDGLIDCSANFDDLKLKINGKEYVIPAKQLVVSRPADTCVFAVTSGPNWVLGDPWLRSYCNIYGFQDKTIGFAKIIA